MKVLFVASEAQPFAASGGLADVAGSLPHALRQRLIGCRIVMPLYDEIPQSLKDQMRFITSFSVPVSWRRQYCGVSVRVCMGTMMMRKDSHIFQGPFLKCFRTLISSRI